MTYEIGDLAQLTVNFTNVNGVPTNPSTVTLLVQAPDTTQITYTSGTITNPTTGAFVQNVPVTMTGIYTYQWTGTGALQAVQQGSFTCAATILNGAQPNAIDLTTIDQVRDWLSMGTATTTADRLYQRLITAASAEFLRLTGRGPADNSNPTQSPFVQPVAYNENYDGSGSDTQFVRNWPITAVSKVTVFTTVIPQSTDQNTPGWMIDGSGKCLVMASLRFGGGYRGNYGWTGGGYGCGYGYRNGGLYAFAEGRQNVNVQYTAGFNGVPYDIAEAVTEMVGLTTNQRGWIGKSSVALSQGGGTVTYSKFVIPPRAKAAIEYYSRRAVV
jgi:hypothetical protein